MPITPLNDYTLCNMYYSTSSPGRSERWLLCRDYLITCFHHPYKIKQLPDEEQEPDKNRIVNRYIYELIRSLTHSCCYHCTYAIFVTTIVLNSIRYYDWMWKVQLNY
jgi:hypothetical protein